MGRRLPVFFWGSVGLIVYTYLGYPLLIAALAHLRGRPADEELAYRDDELPPVTLLIAAHNEEAVISSKLMNSLALDYPKDRLRITVVADGSDDRTAEVVSGFGDSTVELMYRPERRGKVAAVNRAMESVTGDIVVLSDANNDYDESALLELVRPFADPTVGGVVGSKRVAAGDGLLGDSEGLYWRYESYIREMESALGSCTGAVGEIFAIRRSLYEPLPENIVIDDFYLASRLLQRGYRVVYRPRARSTERVSPSSEDELKRRSRIVAGRYQAIALAHRLLPFRRPLLAWQMVSHKFLRPLVPFAMVIALIANLPLALRRARSVYGLALAAQALFYASAALGTRVSAAPLARLLYVPTFLVRSNAAAVAGLIRFLSDRQTHVWERAARRPAADSSTPLAQGPRTV